MKNTKISVAVLALSLLVLTGGVLAQNSGQNGQAGVGHSVPPAPTNGVELQTQAQVQVQNQGQVHGKVEVQVQTQSQTQNQPSPGNGQGQNGDIIKNQEKVKDQERLREGDGNATGAQDMDQKREQHREREQLHATGTLDDATNTPPAIIGKGIAQQHRNEVSAAVQILVRAAEREQGGIGPQVSEMAKKIDDAAATSSQAMVKIESRNMIQTFLFGSDYKNLGELRRQVSATRNDLEQLNRLSETAKYGTSTVEIQEQVSILQQTQAQIENFIKEQEGKFSLFGWLVKMFNK
jgi:hypothetical protein